MVIFIILGDFYDSYDSYDFLDFIMFYGSYDSYDFYDILRIQFDADVVSVLPEGAPPYEKDEAPEGYSASSLFKIHKRFKYFFKGAVANQVQPVRRESLFIEALESMHPSESELLIQVKDRKLKGITKALVDEAFPGLVVKAYKKPAAKKTTTKKKETRPM